MKTGSLARREADAGTEGPKDEVSEAEARGRGMRRMSRKDVIRFVDGMAREVFYRKIEKAERSGTVRRLEAIVLSWPDRRA